jgi:hypothetical protein
MSASGFEHVAELALRLSPEEQLRLVARIEEGLSGAVETGATERFPVGSSAAVLDAMRAAPLLTRDDVDELERAIEAGRMPTRYEGVFDRGIKS